MNHHNAFVASTLLGHTFFIFDSCTTTRIIVVTNANNSAVDIVYYYFHKCFNTMARCFFTSTSQRIILVLGQITVIIIFLDQIQGNEVSTTDVYLHCHI